MTLNRLKLRDFASMIRLLARKRTELRVLEIQKYTELSLAGVYNGSLFLKTKQEQSFSKSAKFLTSVI